jgi:hypothetical protein
MLQSKAFSICEDLLIIGAIINVSGDRKADSYSAFFCGSDNAQEIINEHKVNLLSAVDKATTLVKLILSLLLINTVN